MTADLAAQRERATRTSVTTTGPSGLVLGRTQTGPVAVRLFRPVGTRVFMATPDYVKWLLAFRAVSLGAHITVVTENQRGWLRLTDTIRACGGTIDVGGDVSLIPGQGRPYRPSLVIDETGAVTPQHSLGAWQAVLSLANPAAGSSVTDMRSSDVALVAPVEGRTAENLRRAFALSAQQIRVAHAMGESELLLASIRRVSRVPVPPSPTEYRLLFGG